MFVKKGSVEEFEMVLEQSIINNDSMGIVAREKGIPYFSYYEIAKRALIV